MLKFRNAERSDANTLTDIAFRAKRHWGYPEEWIKLWSLALTITDVAIANNWTCCAELDGVLVGFCMLAIEDTTGSIEHFWIVPEYTQKGIGRSLMEQLLQYAKSKHLVRIMIESDPNAVGFYSKFGTKQIGVVDSMPQGRKIPLLELLLQ